MTSVCPGGSSSSIKLGIESVVIVASGYVVQLLEARGYGWLKLIAPFVPLVSYDLADFCTHDPPAQPTFTADEANALLTLTFSQDFFSGLGKMADLIGNKVWFDSCQCSAPGTVTTPTPQTPPTGTSTVPDVYKQACTYPASGSNAVGAADGAFHGQFTRKFTDFLLPDGSDLFRRNPDRVAVQMRTLRDGGPPADFNFRVRFSGDDGTADYGTEVFTVPSATQTTKVFTRPTIATSIQVATSHTVSGSGDSPDCFLTGLCDTPAGGQMAPCCAPDSYAATTLQAILSLATLVQRQAAPFGYIASTAHAGLTGSGSFAVLDLIGAKVELTTVSTYVGVEEATPDVFFEAGWVSWGGLDGYSARELVTASPMLSFPVLAGQYISIAYNFPVGVVATITELDREP